MMKRYCIYLLIICGLISCAQPVDPAPTPTPPPTPTVNNPGVAALSSPAKNKTCEDGTNVTTNSAEVTFTWAASTNTESYDLVITDLNTNVAITQAGLTATTRKVTLTKAVPYSWRVISKSTKTTNTSTSETWNFYLAGGISNFAPFPAVILTPKTGIVAATNGKVKLVWEGIDPENDALVYTVFIDKVDGKQDPPAAQKNITANSIDVSVEVGQVYYWRIKTSDAQNSSYTTVFQFKVQ